MKQYGHIGRNTTEEYKTVNGKKMPTTRRQLVEVVRRFEHRGFNMIVHKEMVTNEGYVVTERTTGYSVVNNTPDDPKAEAGKGYKTINEAMIYAVIRINEFLDKQKGRREDLIAKCLKVTLPNQSTFIDLYKKRIRLW